MSTIDYSQGPRKQKNAVSQVVGSQDGSFFRIAKQAGKQDRMSLLSLLKNETVQKIVTCGSPKLGRQSAFYKYFLWQWMDKLNIKAKLSENVRVPAVDTTVQQFRNGNQLVWVQSENQFYIRGNAVQPYMKPLIPLMIAPASFGFTLKNYKRIFNKRPEAKQMPSGTAEGAGVVPGGDPSSEGGNYFNYTYGGTLEHYFAAGGKTSPELGNYFLTSLCHLVRSMVRKKGVFAPALLSTEDVFITHRSIGAMFNSRPSIHPRDLHDLNKEGSQGGPFRFLIREHPQMANPEQQNHALFEFFVNGIDMAIRLGLQQQTLVGLIKYLFPYAPKLGVDASSYQSFVTSVRNLKKFTPIMTQMKLMIKIEMPPESVTAVTDRVITESEVEYVCKFGANELSFKGGFGAAMVDYLKFDWDCPSFSSDYKCLTEEMATGIIGIIFSLIPWAFGIFLFFEPFKLDDEGNPVIWPQFGGALALSFTCVALQAFQLLFMPRLAPLMPWWGLLILWIFNMGLRTISIGLSFLASKGLAADFVWAFYDRIEADNYEWADLDYTQADLYDDLNSCLKYHDDDDTYSIKRVPSPVGWMCISPFRVAIIQMIMILWPREKGKFKGGWVTFVRIVITIVLSFAIYIGVFVAGFDFVFRPHDKMGFFGAIFYGVSVYLSPVYDTISVCIFLNMIENCESVPVYLLTICFPLLALIMMLMDVAVIIITFMTLFMLIIWVLTQMAENGMVPE
eukprot:gnl/Carplike_NY0171/453_a628_2105.p1 GENE.gnl/Carplike_NY0171/453_a628_2105~~gnl/Carplike_NY0171/453_a628_2105.p1  ORF type:complete len:733 (-),score=207.88 gnl/Carplike_NY0171/453_a628_2105:287-2485(-)